MGWVVPWVFYKNGFGMKKAHKGWYAIKQTETGGAHGVMVIVVGNGHGDSSSNLGREWLHFT